MASGPEKTDSPETPELGQHTSMAVGDGKKSPSSPTPPKPEASAPDSAGSITFAQQFYPRKFICAVVLATLQIVMVNRYSKAPFPSWIWDRTPVALNSSCDALFFWVSWSAVFGIIVATCNIAKLACLSLAIPSALPLFNTGVAIGEVSEFVFALGTICSLLSQVQAHEKDSCQDLYICAFWVTFFAPFLLACCVTCVPECLFILVLLRRATRRQREDPDKNPKSKQQPNERTPLV